MNHIKPQERKNTRSKSTATKLCNTASPRLQSVLADPILLRVCMYRLSVQGAEWSVRGLNCWWKYTLLFSLRCMLVCQNISCITTDRAFQVLPLLPQLLRYIRLFSKSSVHNKYSHSWALFVNFDQVCHKSRQRGGLQCRPGKMMYF